MVKSRSLNELFKVFFDPQLPILFIVGSIMLAVLGNAVYDLLLNWLGAEPRALGYIAIGSLLILGAIVFTAWILIKLRLRQAEIPEVPVEDPADPHSGLILFVSAGERKAEQASIEFHRQHGALRHCWMIVSPETQQKAGELASQLRQTGVEVELMPLPDAFHARKAYEVVKTAVAHAKDTLGHLGVIVDITGGTKPMTAGAVLVCRESNTPMQYMRSHYTNGELVLDAQPRAMKVEALWNNVDRDHQTNA
jgi:hypothetical protein